MAKLPHDPEEIRMPFGEHLEELRRRLVVSLVVAAVLFLLGWTLLSSWLEGVFLRPYDRAREILTARETGNALPETLKYTDLLEPVFFKLKIALLFALILGLPFFLYQMWQFVGAGLYPKERRVVMGYLPFSLLSAAAGVSFGYFFMIPEVMAFLVSLADPERFDPMPVISRYFSLFMLFTVALAVIFQLPLVLLALSAGGLVDAATLRKYRKHFILGAFVLSAVFTPPEIYSQILMALPTILLFELGVLLVAMRERRSRSPEASA